MRIYDNGVYRDLTQEEILQREQEQLNITKEYWSNTPYEEAVNTEIRKRYSESQEFAILRQKDEKPEEYQGYYDYCEECKAYVKEMKQVETV